MSPRRLVLCALVLVACTACDATAPGRAAYDDGRFQEARDAFESAIARDSENSSPELRYDAALAALRAGDAVGASDAAAKVVEIAIAHDRPDVAAVASFVRGNAAWLRCDAADAESSLPGADATALDRAVAHAETALNSWRDAAVSRDDWPEARRNAERAVLRLAALRKRTSDDANRKDPGAPPPPQPPVPGSDGSNVPPDTPSVLPPPPPPPVPAGQADDATNDPRNVARTDELPQGQVLRVLDTLTAKEREKMQLRRLQRAAPQPSVEKDW